MGIFIFYDGFNSETYQSVLHIILLDLEIRSDSITSDFFFSCGHQVNPHLKDWINKPVAYLCLCKPLRKALTATLSISRGQEI